VNRDHQIPSKTDSSRSNYICRTPNFVHHFENRLPALIIEYHNYQLADITTRLVQDLLDGGGRTIGRYHNYLSASGLNVHLDFYDVPDIPLLRSSEKSRGTF